MEKCCKQCGVIICNKNWVLTHSKNKIVYILFKCKTCHNNCNSCNYTYESSELQTLSKKMFTIIKSRLFYIKSILNPDFVKHKRQYSLDYTNKNKQFISEKNKIKRDYLTDRYIKFLFSRTHKLKARETSLPQELIELKRQQVKLKREYYNKPNKL